MTVLPLTCRANRKALLSASLSTGDWLQKVADYILGYEPCGDLATHMFSGKPLCPKHAELFREALRSPDSLGNVVAGRARTEDEIAAMVEPISDPSPPSQARGRG
jgi:hypothetical protein